MSAADERLRRLRAALAAGLLRYCWECGCLFAPDPPGAPGPCPSCLASTERREASR